MVVVFSFKTLFVFFVCASFLLINVVLVCAAYFIAATGKVLDVPYNLNRVITLRICCRV